MVQQEGKKLALQRELGLVSGTALIVGTMIGSGIFVTPGGVLKQSGSVASSLIIWALSGLTAVFASLSFVELGTLIPESGAEYAYILRTFGNMAGFLYSWIATFIIRPASYAIIVQAFAGYVVEPFYGRATMTALDLANMEHVKTGVTIGALVLICAINCISVRLATVIINSLTFAKLIALAVIVLGGAYKLMTGHTEYLSMGFEHVNGTEASVGSVALAFYSGLWAYDGWDQLNFVTEELADPMRNLPIAVAIGIPLVTIMYVLTNVSYLTILSPSELVSSNAVAISWGENFFGGASGISAVIPWIMTIFVALSTFGAANASLFTSARLLFAASREGHLPEVLSYIQSRCMTPVPSIICLTVIAITQILVMNIETMINFFSFSAWIFYGACFLAVIVLRFTKRKAERPFKVWIIIPIIVTILSVYLVLAPIIQSPTIEYMFVLAFVLLGLVLYFPFGFFEMSIPGMDCFNLCCQDWFGLVPSQDVKAIISNGDNSVHPAITSTSTMSIE